MQFLAQQSPQQAAVYSALVAAIALSQQNFAWSHERQDDIMRAANTQFLTFAQQPAQEIAGVSNRFVESAIPDEQIFQLLATRWRHETAELSSTTEAVMRPEYQTIMGMGEKAIPYILRQLESEADNPDNWFWALRHITRQNPVRPEDRGNRRAMTQAWLDWARYRYVW